MVHVAMKSPRSSAASLGIWVSGDTTCTFSVGKKCPTSVPPNALKTTTIARNISTLQPARNPCSLTNNPRSTRDLEAVIPDVSTDFISQQSDWICFNHEGTGIGRVVLVQNMQTGTGLTR